MQLVRFLLCLLIVGCNNGKDTSKGALARVYDEYLFEKDLVGLVPAGTPKADSVLMVRAFVDRWATRQLLLHAADINLSNKQRATLDDLVKEYQSDLYAKAYLDEVVSRSVDTTVSEQELSAYYKTNRENYRTNGVLVRLRYLHMSTENPKYNLIRTKFFDFKKSDRQFWDTYSMQMISFALNDSVWVDRSQLFARLPFMTPDNIDDLLVSGKTIEHPDGSNIYLVKVVNVVNTNELAPYEYVKPTLKDVIVNSRKLGLMKKFEKEMTADAIKEKDYEILK